mmetsp:Transcript_82425/g.266964  ORF Transcript_82425/g.266964 Transcript_82425/m.266964 type:complete len:752 (+) Transcript_82425:86-2341(+)
MGSAVGGRRARCCALGAACRRVALAALLLTTVPEVVSSSWSAATTVADGPGRSLFPGVVQPTQRTPAAATGPNCSLPALAVGDRLEGSKDLTRFLKKHKRVLVGFSAPSCVGCCAWEPFYQEALPALEAKGVKWVRVDVDRLEAKALAANYDIEGLPAIVFFLNKRPIKLMEEQRPQSLVALVDRALESLPFARSGGEGASFWTAWRSPGLLFRRDTEDADVAGGQLIRVAAMLGPKGRADEDTEEELLEASREFAGRPLSVRFARAGDVAALELLADHPLVSAACGDAAKMAMSKGRRLLVAISLFDGEYVELNRLREPKLGSGGIFIPATKVDATAGGLVFSKDTVSETGAMEVLPRVACRGLDTYDGLSVEQWVLRAALPPVGRFCPSTSTLYEKTGKYFMMLFVDPTRPELPSWLRLLHEAHKRYNKGISSLGASGGGFGAGASGGDIEDPLKLIFVYIDARQHIHRMTSLGLAPDPRRLPALCFNSMTQQVLAWQPEREEYVNGSAVLSAETIDSMVSQFFRGSGKAVTDKPAPLVQPVPRRNVAAGERRNVPELDSLTLQERLRFVQAINADIYNEVVQDSSKDVAVFFFASAEGPQAEASSKAAIFINRCAERFSELEAETVRIVRLDTSEASLPPGVQIPEVPSLLLFPAFSKEPPYKVFRGKWKVQHIMWWIQDQASRPLKLPELPHLDELEASAYWEQKAALPPERQQRIAVENEGMHRPRPSKSPQRQRKGKQRKGEAEL